MLHFSFEAASFIDRRIVKPENPQISLLLDAANFAKTDPNAKCTASVQLFGEYLHAFEDTFGHRNKNNEPIDLNIGLGHGLYNHEPDKTYNAFAVDSLFPKAIGLWDTRESRTLEMERELFSKIQTQFGTTAKSNSGEILALGNLDGFMRQFNNIREAEDNTNSLMSGTDKLDKLNNTLAFLGYGKIPVYNVYQVCLNRQKNLAESNQNNYKGTILATPEIGTCARKRKE